MLLLFFAATGKSAQIPLFNWLPDAMEGPTPVSALIHAATMVTAGVYLLCRMNQVLELSPDAMMVIACVGGATAFVAASIACAQQDIKKVLAFSTVSQIGYMVLAVGSGAYIAAIFLMVCHAFYKGLLFLGAGSVIHGLETEQDLKRMGALRKWLPWTFGTFMVGWLCIAGIPPFSGFWSKGDVLANVFARYPAPVGPRGADRPGHRVLHEPAVLPDLHRQGPLAGPGPRREPGPPHPPRVALGHAHPAHRAGRAGGDGGDPRPALGPPRHIQSWLAPVFAHSLYTRPRLRARLQWILAIVDVVVAVDRPVHRLGAVAAARPTRPELEPAFLQRVWYWDDFYDTVIGRPGPGPGPLLRHRRRRPDDRRGGQRGGLGWSG